MADILTRRGVADGCAVTATGTPDTNVQVAAGHILYDNQLVAVTAATQDILVGHPADATNPRWDAIARDSAGALSLIVGTPTAPDANGLVPPPLNDGTKIILAHIYILPTADPGYTGTITSSVIRDVRSATGSNQFQPQAANENSLIYTFNAAALSNADPGAGIFGFDTTNANTIAHMYINTGSPSIVDSSGPVNDWLASLMPYRLRCWSRSDPLQWIEFDVTAITTHAGYTDVSLTKVAKRNPLSSSILLSTGAQDCVLEYVGPSYVNIRSDPWVLLTKQADTSRASTTTLAADPDLQFAVAASTAYVIRGVVFFDCATVTTIGFKFDFDGPASPTRVMISYADGAQNAAPAFQVPDTALNTSHNVATTNTGEGVLLFNIVLVNGTNAGTFSLRWAQNSSVALNLTVRRGSYLEYMTS